MPITHLKVSAVADGADTTVVRPSDWNAAHTGVNDLDLFVGPATNLLTNVVGVFAASSAYLVAFTVARAVTVATVWFRVAVQSGNLDFGIYDAAGNRLGSTGSFACPVAANSLSRALTGSVALVPATRYFAAFAVDNVTASLLRFLVSAHPQPTNYVTVGLYAAAFPLPSTLAINDAGIIAPYVAFSP